MLLKPITSEKAVKMIDIDNTLLFEVDRVYRKPQIQKEVEKMFSVKVEAVRTHIKGNRKYAYVKLRKENPAIDVATKAGDDIMGCGGGGSVAIRQTYIPVKDMKELEATVGIGAVLVAHERATGEVMNYQKEPDGEHLFVSKYGNTIARGKNMPNFPSKTGVVSIRGLEYKITAGRAKR